MPDHFQSGLHEDSEAGPVDVGLAVSGGEVGLAIEAPIIGQLRAAFELLEDGTTKLTALTRRTAAGAQAMVLGFTDEARAVRLELELRERTRDLERLEVHAKGLQAALDEHETQAEARITLAQSALSASRAALDQREAKDQAAQGELTRLQAALIEAEARGEEARVARQEADQRLQQTHAELSLAKMSLQGAEGRLRSAKTELTVKLSAAESALAQIATRLEQSEEKRRAGERELDASRSKLVAVAKSAAQVDTDKGTRLERLESERADEAARTAEVTGERDALATKLAEVEATLITEREVLAGKLSDAEVRLVGERDAVSLKLAEVEATLAADRERHAAQLTKAQGELAAVKAEAEKKRRELERAVKVDREKHATALKAEGETHAAALRLESEKRVAEVTEAQATMAAGSAAYRTGLEAEREKRAAAEAELQEVTARLGAQLHEVTARLEAQLHEVTKKLEGVQAVSDRRMVELEEQRKQRDELGRDLEYIRSQVADLSSTKGALVSRVNQMSKREEQRRRSTAEFQDLLRDAEVVAADRRTRAVKEAARAGKLAEELGKVQWDATDLRAKLEASETMVQQLSDQLNEVTEERDKLRVDVTFFQKQLGAIQRAKAQLPKDPGKKP